MAKLNYSTKLASAGMFKYPSGAGKPLPAPLHARRDFRFDGDTRGVVRAKATLKISGNGLVVPFASARVWLMRLADGGKVWEGVTDSQGNYVATSLVVGEWYVPVGIDPNLDQKCVAGGPVQAVLEV
ncbi:hypothetical protein ABE501_05355 [Comamonas testosteroni]